MRISFLIGVAAILLIGCRSKDDVPYLGRWDGEFVVTRLTGKTQINQPKRNNWKGYIQLYRTADGDLGNRCQMHIENEQEGVDLKGHWKIAKRQIKVVFNDIKIDDAGGIDERDPNKSYLQASQIRSAFGIALPLNVESDLRHLKSPLIFFGPLVGTYSFEKAALSH